MSTLIEEFKNDHFEIIEAHKEVKEPGVLTKEALEVFAKDLESASRFVFGFFDRCDKGPLEANLSRDFETLFMVIRDRMRNEENFLYGEYKELNKL